MTPLHIACHMNAPAGVISALIAANPSSISFYTACGYSPLHVAIWRQASAEIIREFVRCAPSALWKQTKSDCTPLHLACWDCNNSNNASAANNLTTGEHIPSDVINILLEADPRTAMIQTVEMDTPLHYAAMRGASDDVILSFIRSCPDVVTVVNNQGDTALHICCRNGISVELLKAFLSACCPVAAMLDENECNTEDENLHVAYMVNDAGNAPLHELCASVRQPMLLCRESVELLLRYAPEAACKPNFDGNYPIHLASQNTACLDVFSMLLEQDCDAVTLERNYAGMTPLDYWCRSYGEDFEREIQVQRDCCAVNKKSSIVSFIAEDFHFWRVASLFLLYLYNSKSEQNSKKHCTNVPFPSDEHFNLASQAELTALAAASMRGLHPMIYRTSFSQFLRCIREGVIDSKRLEKGNSRYLLNKVIVQGMEWSHVKIILDAYPDVLSEQDESSSLYPFMLAAAAAANTETATADDSDNHHCCFGQLDTSFELLKAAPNLVLANLCQ